MIVQILWPLVWHLSIDYWMEQLLTLVHAQQSKLTPESRQSQDLNLLQVQTSSWGRLHPLLNWRPAVEEPIVACLLTFSNHKPKLSSKLKLLPGKSECFI